MSHSLVLKNKFIFVDSRIDESEHRGYNITVGYMLHYDWSGNIRLL
jgi:hypothetical protein